MPQRQIRNAESKWLFYFPVCFKNHNKKVEINHNKVCLHNGG